MDPAEVGRLVGERYALEGLELTPLDGGADLAASEEQQRWFMEGYGTHAADADLLTYYRGLRLLEDASELAAIVIAPSSTDEDRDEALGHLTNVFSPTGMLVQARPESRRS